MATKKNILICDRFAQESFFYLSGQALFNVARSDHPFHLPMEELHKTHALIIRSRTPINEDLLKKARNLQLIITCTSGFDHIDLTATQKWGITVMHTPAANIESASQLTFSLALSCATRLQEARLQIQSGEWNRDALVGTELFAKRYGVVGLGRIGKRVCQIAQAFGMQTMAYDPYLDEEDFEKIKVERLGFDELVKSVDVLSFHVPKTPETEHMLKLHHLESVQNGLILVNTSRGSVLSESDLIQALDKGWIASLGLDVFQKEPLPKESPLLQHKRIVLSPHIGANTEDAFFRASRLAAEKLVNFFIDGSTSDSLPPRVPWYV